MFTFVPTLKLACTPTIMPPARGGYPRLVLLAARAIRRFPHTTCHILSHPSHGNRGVSSSNYPPSVAPKVPSSSPLEVEAIMPPEGFLGSNRLTIEINPEPDRDAEPWEESSLLSTKSLLGGSKSNLLGVALLGTGCRRFMAVVDSLVGPTAIKIV
jgi:hypothetical protein